MVNKHKFTYMFIMGLLIVVLGLTACGGTTDTATPATATQAVLPAADQGAPATATPMADMSGTSTTAPAQAAPTDAATAPAVQAAPTDTAAASSGSSQGTTVQAT